MIICADDGVDRDSATKSVVNAVSFVTISDPLSKVGKSMSACPSVPLFQADYMVSFMNYVDPSNKMLQCRLQMKIRGVKRPIGVTVLPNQSVVVSSSGDANEVKLNSLF